MGEPVRLTRMKIGLIALLFLGLMFIPAYYLKKEFWKDVH
jgi:ubiquinol-cytochrome c reductase cytochrome c1 subunit